MDPESQTDCSDREDDMVTSSVGTKQEANVFNTSRVLGCKRELRPEVSFVENVHLKCSYQKEKRKN